MSPGNQNAMSIYDQVVMSSYIQKTNLSTRILFSFIFIAIFSQIVFSGFETNDPYGNSGYASISITSYTITLMSLMCLVFLNTIIQTESGKNNAPFFRTLSFDIVLLFIYIIWLISIYLKYYKHINLKKVPPQFFMYSNITNMAMLFQIFFFMVMFIVQESDGSEGDSLKSNISRLRFVNYLVVFLNFILILIQQIILDSFAVDIA